MRYIRSKNDKYSNLSRILEGAARQPLIGNCVSQNSVISAPDISEQVYAQTGQQIRYMDMWTNNGYTMDTNNFAYEVKNEEGVFALFYNENVIKYIERSFTKREQNNHKGGLTHTRKIKDKPIEICAPIFFKHVERFMREDKPDKHYFNVYTTDEITDDLSWKTKVIEKGVLNSPKCSMEFKSEIVKVGQEKLCSDFFRTEIYRVSKSSTEIMIPSRPGWYNDEVFGWVFLELARYKSIDKTNLPPAMRRRYVGRTERTINEVFSDLEPMIDQCLQKKILWCARLISPLLMPLWRLGIAVMTIIVAIIDNTNQMSASAAILKTGDFDNFDSLSLYSSTAEIDKEIGGARDGVATFIGPMTAAESKKNGQKVNYVLDAALGANGADKTARAIISMIGRYIPIDLPLEFVLNIDCKGIANDTNVKNLRSFVLEFDAAYISYIEDHFDVVEGCISSAVEQYKAEPVPEIDKNKEGLFIALYALRKLMKGCFKIELFSEDEFKRVSNLFKESATEIIAPDYDVRNQFFDISHQLLSSGKFIITELKDAHKNYSEDGTSLILDRKKRFLNFPKEALDMIAQMIPSVKDGDELAATLKACKSIHCTDNGARPITIPGGRPGFYSVFISEFDYDILKNIDNLGLEEFFFDPKEVPADFVPLLWQNGRCAGKVLDGKGLPNPHINVSGLSGMGKNRGAYKIAEGHWRLKNKVIFLDIKGGITDDSLNSMECDQRRYVIHDLKTEGFPFPIFNLSEFTSINAKVSYVLKVIGAAVNLTEIQNNDLSVYVESMISEDTISFSIQELFEKVETGKKKSLKNKLQPIVHMINSYTAADGKYKYASCREFINDTGKILILSIFQDSVPALRSIVYTLLQAIFEYQVLDNSKRLVIFADEMQKYTADSPFRNLYAEAREFRMSITAMTQEYRSPTDETRKISSNAATEIFYPPTSDSEKRVKEKVGKKYNVEEHHENGVGNIWVKAYLWSKKDNCHKFVVLNGMNDDKNFSELQSYPKNYYGTGY